MKAVASEAVSIPLGEGTFLQADLAVPAGPAGLVIFAHGSGSGRSSPRNRRVAEALQESGLATLLLDLLTPAEEAADSVSGEYRFNISLLTERLARAAAFARSDARLSGLPIGYFGASTGAAAALRAAAEDPRIDAVVSRGGRPDLAGPALARVQAPVLFIVGGADDPRVIRWNEEAAARVRGARGVRIVPSAGHLFEERGALETVIALSRDWFRAHLAAKSRH